MAEPSLQQFSEQVADDLPRDVAMLNYLQGVSEEFAASPVESSADQYNCHLVMPFQGERFERESQQLPDEIDSYDVGRTYELNFSQHYRTQLLRVCYRKGPPCLTNLVFWPAMCRDEAYFR